MMKKEAGADDNINISITDLRKHIPNLLKAYDSEQNRLAFMQSLAEDPDIQKQVMSIFNDKLNYYKNKAIKDPTVADKSQLAKILFSLDGKPASEVVDRFSNFAIPKGMFRTKIPRNRVIKNRLQYIVRNMDDAIIDEYSQYLKKNPQQKMQPGLFPLATEINNLHNWLMSRNKSK